MTKPTAPKGLTRRSAALWRQATAGYVLSASELMVLHEALVSLDRANQAAEVLDAEGTISTDRYGSPRAPRG